MGKKTDSKRYKDVRDLVPAITSFNVTRYTWDAWKKCYPTSTKDEWETVTMPESVALFLDHMPDYDELVDDGVAVEVVTLDDEYFEWLGGRKNTSDMRAKYAESIHPDEATRLMMKNGLDVETHTRLLRDNSSIGSQEERFVSATRNGLLS